MGASSMETNSGQPCEICGDTGYEECIVICSKCQKSREHNYCMRRSLNQVSEPWCCEQCQCHNLDDQGTCHSDSKGEVKDERRKICGIGNLSSKVSVAGNAIRSSSDKPKPSMTNGRSNSEMSAFATNGSLHKKTCASVAPEKDHTDKSAENPKPGTAGGLSNLTSPKLAIATSQSLHEFKSSFRFVEEDLPNPPAASPSWRGRLEILHFPREFYVQAHPPEKVSRKAYLALNNMPGVLQFTLQPRLVVWPAAFNTGSLSGFDIGLYVWADDCCRSKEIYSSLVQLMEEQDLSMQSRLDGVELLIFTSKQLPVESQRMNSQCYLWGVFLSSKRRPCSVDLKAKYEAHFPSNNDRIGEYSAGVTPKVDDQVVDMEIDMVGGKEVGRVDKCMRRNSMSCSRDSLDVPSQDMVSRVALGAPPKFSRHHAPGSSSPATSNTNGKGLLSAASRMKRSLIGRHLDVPPGFSKMVKPKERDSSSEDHQKKLNPC